jgi:hypothetical protein
MFRCVPSILSFRGLAVIAILVNCPMGNSAAQTLDLQVRDELTSQPVAGALARLLRGDGTPVVQGLTNESGRLTLRAPASGSYRLRIDRIGWVGLLTESFLLEAGQTTRRDIVMPAERRELPTLEVRGTSRCDPGAEGGGRLAATLWEEIRTALTANVLSERQMAAPLLVREFTREVTLGGRLEREWVFRAGIQNRAPFTSVSPAHLASVGFVHAVRDSLAFSAPDAALLLSDEFVGTHCFRAVEGEQGLVGLAFAPTPGRTVPDVQGTLWVERLSSELKALDFDYVGLPDLLQRARLGGRVEFQRHQSGAWIVAYWHIRMPVIDSVTVRGTGNTRVAVPRVVSYVEQGGRAEITTRSASAIVNHALVRGTVVDSTVASAPGLPGTVVWVEGFADSARTDSLGRFELAVPMYGSRTVLADHPRLRLLGEAPSKDVRLSLGDTVPVSFATPSIQTVARRSCGRSGNRAGLIGQTWDTAGSARAGMELRVRAAVAQGWREEHTRSGPGGLFAFCNLPADATLEVTLLEDGLPVTAGRVRLEPQEYRWLDLRPGATETQVASAPGAPTQRILTGVVRQDSTGDPVPGVDVLLEGTRLTAVTTNAGRYTLRGVPLGVSTLLFRSVGWRPVRMAVRIVEADTVWADARMLPEGVILDPIEVRAAPVDPWRQGLTERQRIGLGTFIDSVTLRQSEHLKLADVMRRLPGIAMTWGWDRDRNRIMYIGNARRRGRDGTPCMMQIVVNGIPVGGDVDARREFEISSLKAIELYQGGAQVPIEYGGATAQCGVVVLWTKP